MAYHRRNHAKYLNLTHLVMVCKYRKRLLVPFGAIVKDLMREIAARYGIDIVQMEVDKDHIHLLIDSKPFNFLRAATFYFSITPHAILSPELPEGSDIRSSGFAWITSAVPPSWKSEFAPSPSVAPSIVKLVLALPFWPTIKFGKSPTWGCGLFTL